MVGRDGVRRDVRERNVVGVTWLCASWWGVSCWGITW